jgi:hypothetical protein
LGRPFSIVDVTVMVLLRAVWEGLVDHRLAVRSHAVNK